MSDLGVARRELEGRRALVLGGSGGIGRCVVDALLARGARVVASGRDAAALEAVAGAGAGTVTHDLLDGPPAALVDAATEQLGGLDVLVSAVAHGAAYARLEGFDAGALRAAFDVKVARVLEVVALAAPALRGTAEEPGVVALLAGNSARHPTAMNLQTAAVNAALVTAAACLAVDLAPAVRVVAVSPGPTRTARFEALTAELGSPGDGGGAAVWSRHLRGGPAEPEDVGEAVATLCGPAGRLVNGTEVVIDGGWS